MGKHIQNNELERYLLGELTPAELSTFDSHIGQCGECRLTALKRTDLGIYAAALEYGLTAESSGHLTYDELEGIADQALTGNSLNRAEAHLDRCGECREDVAELRGLAQPAVPVTPDPVHSAMGLPGQLARMFSARSWNLAAAAGALLLIGFLIWFPWRGKPPAEVALSTATPQIDSPTVTATSAPQPENANIAVTPEIEPAVTTESELAVFLSDGGIRVGIDGAGKLVGYDRLTQKQGELLRAAFRNGVVTVGTEAKEVFPGSAKRMGENSSAVSGGFGLDDPVGKIVDTGRPSFSWQPLEGAVSYRVDVFDVNYRKVASSGDLRDTRWAIKLPRGQTYIWQVTALKDGKEIRSSQAPATEARFRMLDQVRSRNLATIRRRYPRAHLLLGLAYAEAGLIDEARRELVLLSRENRKSPIPQSLLIRLERAVRRP